MPPREKSTRGYLKAETDDLHDTVDLHASAFDLSTSNGLRGFLTFMLGGCAPLEAALDQAGADKVWESWPHRRRSDLLLDDLRCARPDAVTFGAAPSPAMIWGIFYVLEGSRVGGKLLARDGKLAFRSRFLEDAATCRQWPSFIARLETAIVTPGDRHTAVEGARFAFSQFLKDENKPNIG